MKKWFLVIMHFVAATSVLAQNETVVIRVKARYAVINKGINHGVKEGDRLRLYTPNNPNQYGDVEVIRALRSVSAVRLLQGTQGYRLKIGDLDSESEETIVDELLSDTQNDIQRPQPRNHGVNRRGFILGLGIGFGGSYLQANYGAISGDATRSAFLTNFKIGYAPTNTLEVYYANKVFWWDESGLAILIHGLSAFGVTKYMNSETASGPFVSGGLGISVLDAPFENVNPSYGFGVFMGTGYEFTKHWSLETSFMYSNISDSGVNLGLFGLRLTINGLIY